jgi:branched-chain amino acid transport system ATP-binding protein
MATFSRKDNQVIEEDVRLVFAFFTRLKECMYESKGWPLSGGKQQMLAVVRAFLSGRKVMLLDESSKGFAPLLMLNMFIALKEINEEGTTILLVE